MLLFFVSEILFRLGIKVGYVYVDMSVKQGQENEVTKNEYGPSVKLTYVYMVFE